MSQSEAPQFQHWKKTHDLEGMGLKQVINNDTSRISDYQGEDGTDDSGWIEDNGDWLTNNDNTEWWVGNSKAKALDPEDKENEARDESDDSNEEDLLGSLWREAKLGKLKMN